MGKYFSERIAEFEKVSEIQFKNGVFQSTNSEAESSIKKEYEDLVLPKRATSGSAGYDFYTPYDINIAPGEIVLLPTGIRCKMLEGWVLMLFPRSGLGFKYGLQLRNTVGIIDSDYYFAHNEGHIMAKLVNTGDDPIYLPKGTAFMQGVFLKYGITGDDDVDTRRVGGFGSTD